MDVLDRVEIVEGKWAVLGVNVGHPIGDFMWRNCAKLLESIEMSFEVVSGVGQKMWILHGAHIPWQKEKLGFIAPVGLNGVSECILTLMYSTRA